MKDDSQLPPLARDQFRSTLEKTAGTAPPILPRRFHPPFLLWGILFFCLGVTGYLIGVGMGVPRALFGLDWLYNLI